VEELDTEQHAAEPVAVKVAATDATPPSPAGTSEPEPEQQSAVVTPAEVSSSTVTPFSVQGTAAPKDSKPQSIEFAPALPVAISVPPESRLVALTEPNSLGAERFRALVTRLEHLQTDHELKSFQVTSSVIHEGKTLVSGNVAVALAKYSGSKTLLIDGDLHRPTLATMFGLTNLRGLSHWWNGQDEEIGEFVYRLGDLPLWFLPAGQPCDQPSDILPSARFVKAFSQLASQVEWVVVDSTPMLPIADVNLWSRLVDGTLLVVREGVTPVKALKQGLLALDHPKIIGVVLNDASATNEAK
jgi:capsular exopolysaccharide synthesis family protein